MNTFDEIRNILVFTLGCEPSAVTMEALIEEDLGADSLDDVEILMALEDFFDVNIDDEKADGWKTVGDIDRHIKMAIADREMQVAEG